MSDENVELLRRAWAAYDVGNVEGFEACLTDDWREYGPSGPSGGFVMLDDERRAMESHRIAFPDKHTEIHHIVADDADVVTIQMASLDQEGLIEMLGSEVLPKLKAIAEQV